MLRLITPLAIVAATSLASVMSHPSCQKKILGSILQKSFSSDGSVLYYLEDRNSFEHPNRSIQYPLGPIILNSLSVDGTVRELKLPPEVSSPIAEDEVPQRIALQATKAGVVVSSGARMIKFDGKLNMTLKLNLDLSRIVEPSAEIFNKSGKTLWIIGPSMAKYRSFFRSWKSKSPRGDNTVPNIFPSKKDFLCLTFSVEGNGKLVAISELAFMTAAEPVLLLTSGDDGYVFNANGIIELTPLKGAGLFGNIHLADAPKSAVLHREGESVVFVTSTHELLRGTRDETGLFRVTRVKPENFTPNIVSSCGQNTVVFDTAGKPHILSKGLGLSSPKSISFGRERVGYAAGSDDPHRFACISEANAYLFHLDQASP